MSKKNTIIIELIFLFPLLTASQAYAAKLHIKPPTGAYKINQQFEAEIILDTEGEETAGTDIVLSFDPNILKGVEIKEGKTYETYIGKDIDNEQGTITASGIISLDAESGFSGAGSFASVVFQGKQAGVSQVDFDYTPGNKNDSNVAIMEDSGDNLSKTTGASYTITASQDNGDSNGGNGGDNNNGGGNGGDGGNGSNGGNGSGKGGPVPPTKAAKLPESGLIGDTVKTLGAGLGALLLSLLLLL